MFGISSGMLTAFLFIYGELVNINMCSNQSVNSTDNLALAHQKQSRLALPLPFTKGRTKTSLDFWFVNYLATHVSKIKVLHISQ